MSKKALSNITAEKIYNMIVVEKRFKPGDKLPPEMKFAEELNISRTTFREAAKQLMERGVLEIKRGNGTFVTEKAGDMDELHIGGLIEEKMDVKDLIEVRLLLEPEMVALAAQRATEVEIKRICRYGEQLEALILANESKGEMEQNFHLSIMQAVHNSFMDKFVPLLFIAIGQTSQMFWQGETLSDAAIEDHKMIMEYIKTRDSDGAKAAMKLHILRGIRDLKQRGEWYDI